MPVMNPKNFALSPAGMDLGLGDQLAEKTDEASIEARRKRLQQQQEDAMKGKAPGSTPALMDLFGGPMNGL